MSSRPFIGLIKPQDWIDGTTGEEIPGVIVVGVRGIAAHLTKREAYAVANDLVDAADTLPEQPEARQVPTPCYSSHSDTLTAADGSAEPPLPTTAPE